jgi:hypothetical protein
VNDLTANWQIDDRLAALSMKPLADAHDSLPIWCDELQDWLHDEARRLYDESDAAMDECPSYVLYCEHSRAREFAEKALLTARKGIGLSTAVVSIVRAWCCLRMYVDPVRKMQLQLLTFRGPIDALAGVVDDG